MKKTLDAPECRQVWKKDNNFYNFLRGAIRKAVWQRHPIKLKFIQDKRFKIKNPSKRKRAKKEIWGAKCEICEGVHPLKNIQVDHIVPAGSLLKKEDIQGFVERMAIINYSDLQLLCKPCHVIKTRADAKNISFEQAKKEKIIIEILKKPIIEQKNILKKRGYNDHQISNKEKREKLFKKIYL